jgi:hypothetical protein
MIPEILTQEKTKQRTWYGCYDESWQNLIQPESFQHPAKYAFGLIKRIYPYMLSQGYIQPGATILDPFGGMGGGAVANFYGLNWVGCELERKFHDMGQGCDCTGISPEEWLEYGEAFADTIGQLNYKDGRHWCPACIAGALQIKTNGLNGHRQPGLFDTAEDSRLPVGFKLSEEGTPYSLPHHYTGNLELFRKYAQPGTWAVLLNGDSRYLRAVIAQAQVDGLLSSPPYANGCAYTGGDDPNPRLIQGSKVGAYGVGRGYGSTEGQLGGMKEGNLDGILTSPPFAGNTGGRGDASRNGIDAALFDRHSGGMKRGTGENPDNLDHLPMKGLAEALLSSPPYAGSLERPNGIDASKIKRPGGVNSQSVADPRYGVATGQLGAMPNGGLDSLLSSPPFENQNACNDPKYHANRTTNGGPLHGDYGTTTGQLGTMTGGFSKVLELGQLSEAEQDKALRDAQEERQAWRESNTFWSAARLIVEESYHLLKPGAYSAWVCKAFIRNGERVEFPNQWRQLCEACGFEFVEEIRAMLVTEKGIQIDLDGKDKRLKIERKSFFRRLHESRLTEDQAHLRIDWETVIIMRKPLR